jgi:hypothetical protein
MTFLNNLLPVANSRGEVPDFNRSSQRVERKKEQGASILKSIT